MKRGEFIGRAEALTWVLFHRDADGFASAVAAWCALGMEGPDGRGVRYESVQYGEPCPALESLLDGQAVPCRVYILDFSYPRAVLMELLRRGVELVVLDHHKTAAAELEGLACCTFDMSKAGCQLAWEYFARPEHVGLHSPMPELLAESGPDGQRMPEMLRAIATRDLWRHVHLLEPDRLRVEAICAYMETVPWDFDSWANVLLEWHRASVLAVKQGEAVVRYQRTVACRQAERCHAMAVRHPDGSGGTLEIVGCNAATLQSETAHELLRDHPDKPVVAVYVWEGKGIRVSLRGRGWVDCSAIAKQYEGGGGHHDAAGFFYPCPLPKFRDGEMESADSRAIDLVQLGQLYGEGVAMVATERMRQSAMGYDALHDVEHEPGTLAKAGAAYIQSAASLLKYNTENYPALHIPGIWPFEKEAWKPGPPLRMLTKGAALVLAEIDRAGRGVAKAKEGGGL